MVDVKTSGRRLWLVRHGETEGQSSIRYHGSNDVRLSNVGREQIRGLLPLLMGVDFVRVIQSPLQRATESATILSGGLSLPQSIFEVDQRLREICFGDAEGMTREEIAAAFPDFWPKYEAGEVDAFPGGEPRTAFAARVASATSDLARGDWDGDVLVVAHRGTVKHMIRAALGVDAASPADFAVDLGSLSVLRQAGGSWQLDLLGMRP